MKRFNFEGKQFTVIMDAEGKPWFVAKEVCVILGIKNVGNALSRLDPDEKNTIRLTDGNRGNPNRAIVSEPGLYKLIQRSRQPAAMRFDRWARHDVLPSIRKTGGYSTGQGLTIKDLPVTSCKVNFWIVFPHVIEISTAPDMAMP